MDTNELPKEFVYHSDCMIDWKDMPGVDVEAVEAYAEAHRQELMLPIIKSNPNMPIEKITDWMLHDQALAGLTLNQIVVLAVPPCGITM